MFYTYILRSIPFDRNYYGYCGNLDERLKSHNAGKVRSTKPYRPWLVNYFETFETKTEAIKREHFFESIDGYNFLKRKGII